MENSEEPKFELFTAEATTLTLRNLQLTSAITIDEVELKSGDLLVVPSKTPGGPLTVSGGETTFRAMMTEANVNRLLSGHTPSSAPVRNMRVTLFSGRAQFKGQYLKSVMGLPFTLDAKPVITDGVRIKLDCSGSHVGGIGLPAAVVEVIEHALNEKLTIDLSESQVPVRIDEIRCEPGRLTIVGRAKLAWPAPALPFPDSSPRLSDDSRPGSK